MNILILLIPLAFSHQLVHVIEYSRHGARAPKYNLPSQKYQWPKDELYQLTPAGIRQHYLIGYEFRKRYIEDNQLLPFIYNPITLEIHTSDSKRTIQSAQAQMSGLYPEGTGPLLENQIQYNTVPPYPLNDLEQIQKELQSKALPYSFQVIPVTHQRLDDYIIDNGAWDCPKMVEYQNQYLNSQEFKDYESDYNKNLRQKVAKVANVSYEQADFMFAQDFYDIVKCNDFHGYGTFDGLDQDMIKQLKYNDWIFYYKYFQPDKESTRLKTGAFWHALFDNFDAQVQGIAKLRFNMFSGHDDTLAALLKSMEIHEREEDYKQPQFASTLIFELYQKDKQAKLTKDENQFYVKVIYNDEELSARGCSKMCPYSEFKKLFENDNIADIQAACGVTDLGIQNIKKGEPMKKQLKVAK